MLPALAKAREVQAAQDTAASIGKTVERLERIEAKLDEILALLKSHEPPPLAAHGKGR